MDYYKINKWQKGGSSEPLQTPPLLTGLQTAGWYNWTLNNALLKYFSKCTILSVLGLSTWIRRGRKERLWGMHHIRACITAIDTDNYFLIVGKLRIHNINNNAIPHHAIMHTPIVDYTLYLLLYPSVLHTHTYTADEICCPDKPILEDFLYAKRLRVGALRWSSHLSCTDINGYEVLYVQTMCNASDAPVERVRTGLTNRTSIFLPPSDVYCIKVRAVTNENCYSRYSTCAQVAPLEQGKLD